MTIRLELGTMVRWQLADISIDVVVALKRHLPVGNGSVPEQLHIAWPDLGVLRQGNEATGGLLTSPSWPTRMRGPIER